MVGWVGSIAHLPAVQCTLHPNALTTTTIITTHCYRNRIHPEVPSPIAPPPKVSSQISDYKTITRRCTRTHGLLTDWRCSVPPPHPYHYRGLRDGERNPSKPKMVCSEGCRYRFPAYIEGSSSPFSNLHTRMGVLSNGCVRLPWSVGYEKGMSYKLCQFNPVCLSIVTDSFHL